MDQPVPNDLNDLNDIPNANRIATPRQKVTIHVSLYELHADHGKDSDLI